MDTPNPTPPKAPGGEFIALMALTTSLVAMSIDTMVPALGTIARELGASNPNDGGLVLHTFFGGMMCGLLIYGSVSDSIGRKPTLLLGTALFIIGNLLCATASSFGMLLAGRVLAGFGAASPRIISIAVVRDVYAGRGMARVMSFVSVIFILVPVFAPAIGQGVLAIGSWRAIFAGLIAFAVIDVLWFLLRQPETLPPERRVAFSFRGIAHGIRETFKHPLTFGYMVSTGFVFGAFVNYLAVIQPLLQEQYRVGTLFPLYFGILAAGIGVASFVNGRLVMRFGMQRLSRIALLGTSSLSLVAFLGALALGGHPPLWAFIGYMLPCFFFNGIAFGNFNARAMEPMGKIAGVAAAVTGAVSTLVALAIGAPFSRAYDGTVRPIIAGYMTCGLLALALTTWAERANTRQTAPAAEGN